MRVLFSNYVWLNATDLGYDKVKRLQKSLIIRPQKTFDKGDSPEPIEMFRIWNGCIGVPRNYYLKYRQKKYDVRILIRVGRGNLPGSNLGFLRNLNLVLTLFTVTG